MFTGIIESFGILENKETEGSNVRFFVKSSITSELKVDQSVAHNGVCLTVEKIVQDVYQVVAIKETLDKTNLADWEIGNSLNLERCMIMNARLDGHIVQGHVDTVATVKKIEKEAGSTLFKFELQHPSKLIVEKGSICVNGVSLTAFDVCDVYFSVAIIPYTIDNTNFKGLSIEGKVNIEFDIIGKYVARLNA